jgi:hypothetical protein
MVMQFWLKAAGIKVPVLVERQICKQGQLQQQIQDGLSVKDAVVCMKHAARERKKPYLITSLGLKRTRLPHHAGISN